MGRKNFIIRLSFVGLALYFFFMPLPSQASTVTFDMDTVLLGQSTPAGSSPWLRATFTDGPDPGTVKLIMQPLNMTANQFIDGTTNRNGGWYFNFNPTKLAISTPNISYAGSGLNENNADYFRTGTFQAGSTRAWFNIQFRWNRVDGEWLENGQTSTYVFTSNSYSILPEDFLFKDNNDTGNYYSVVGLQWLNVNDNPVGRWIADPPSSVPEPGTLLLLGAGILGLGIFRRNRR